MHIEAMERGKGNGDRKTSSRMGLKSLLPNKTKQKQVSTRKINNP